MYCFFTRVIFWILFSSALASWGNSVIKYFTSNFESIYPSNPSPEIPHIKFRKRWKKTKCKQILWAMKERKRKMKLWNEGMGSRKKMRISSREMRFILISATVVSRRFQLVTTTNFTAHGNALAGDLLALSWITQDTVY